MIRFENVSKTFRGNGKQVEAVKEVSLHIKKGEIFGIIGYSGAGKSDVYKRQGYGSPGKNNHDIPGCDGAWDFPDTDMKFSFYSHQQEIFSISTICVKEREG